MSWYSAQLGAHTFEVAPSIAPEVQRIVRQNATPNEAVACLYRIELTCRVREDASDTAADKLGTFLADCLHTRTCPALTIDDAAGNPIPEWGEIDPDAVDGSNQNLGWEDVRLVAYRLPPGDGQLMAGATFTLTIEARRSLPDDDGICELDQVYDYGTDEAGNDVERLVSRVRFAKASGATIDDAAVLARVRLPAPVGTTRVDSYREPLYPLRHVAEYTSEVSTTTGVTGASGATAASSSARVVDVPEKGIRRLIDTAQTSGGEDPLSWVEGQAPSGQLVSASTSLDVGTTRAASGEWRRIESYKAGQTTKVTRTFALRGGGRQAGAVLMSPPVRPKIQRGPHEPWRLVESIEVRALAPSELAHFAVPDPLSNPWVLLPQDHALPRVEEDARDPSQRLWVWTVTREYLWSSEDEPLNDPALIGAVFAAKDEVL